MAEDAEITAQGHVAEDATPEGALSLDSPVEEDVFVIDPEVDAENTEVLESAAEADETAVLEPAAEAAETAVLEPVAEADETVVLEPVADAAETAVLDRAAKADAADEPVVDLDEDSHDGTCRGLDVLTTPGIDGALSDDADVAAGNADAAGDAGAPELFARASGLALRTSQGCPYADLFFTVNKGQVFAIRGRSGSGKTALLLTLAGRMKHTEGELEVLGLPLPKKRRKVQRQVALSLFNGVSDLPMNATVHAAASAEFSMRHRKGGASVVMDYLREWQLGDVAYAFVRDLSGEQLCMLGIALAMVGDPVAIVIDDIEKDLLDLQSDRLMSKLLDIAHNRGITVLVGCVSRDLAARADGVCNLG